MNSIADSLPIAWSLVSGGDPQLLRVVILSLQVSSLACLFGAVIGILAGAALAVWRFPGQRALVVVVNTLLALPSVVVGLTVYLLLSRSGPLGSWGLLFTPTAMVIAQSILVAPLIAALTRRLLLSALAEGGDQLRSLGAGGFEAMKVLHQLRLYQIPHLARGLRFVGPSANPSLNAVAFNASAFLMNQR